MATKLQVKDLKISFRTISGKLQAVRGINFDLSKGETLAIVGESGSGKSVTSKAILGILAGNSIVEGGEILYDGKDLLKIPEEEFHKIRGDKIAMIFQDPLSSLNPIVKIGKQLTEAMLLKGKARQKSSRKDFNSTLSLLNKLMIASIAKEDAEKAAELTSACKSFNKFEFKHIELEKAYNEAHNSCVGAIDEIENILFLIDKKALKNAKREISEAVNMASKSAHRYVVSSSEAEKLASLVEAIKQKLPEALKNKSLGELSENLTAIKEILEESAKKEVPNFFCMGYYLTFASEPLPEMPVDKLNEFLREYLDSRFMLEFIKNTKTALEYSAANSYAAKEKALSELRSAATVIADTATDGNALSEIADKLVEYVNKSIDPIEINKDSMAYTFATSIRAAVDVYNKGVKNNESEKSRYEKQKAKYDRITEKKGKAPDWKVAPLAVVDLELARVNIEKIVTRLADIYEKKINNKASRNYADEAIAIIDYLKQCASGVVNRITRAMAKTKAIKLMEEVGIPDARARFKQYPFEFSGGMRQRIVIAIALAADPDILICDEPTTALDVTIQAQILELINNLKKERNLSVIFITHDLGVVANMADRIAVMYAGKIVEYGTSEEIFYDPRHPYTWALLASMPDLDTSEKLDAIPGTPPNLIYPPVGDAFAARNKYAMKIDFEAQPPMFDVTETHKAATWLLHPDAPKAEMPKIISDRIARMTANTKNTEGGAEND